MVADHRYQYFAPLRYYVEVVPHALHYLIKLPVNSAVSFIEHIRNNEELLEKNKHLLRKNALLSVRMNAIETLEKENRYLRSLLHATRNLEKRRFMTAELIRASKVTGRHHFLIGKGEYDGVRVGQPILDAHGILGQVVSVTPYTATGILITDVSYSLQVKLKRLGLRVLAVGTGSPNKLKLRYVPGNTDVKVGDIVVSSGLDELYPPDFPVGHITEVRHPPGNSFADIVVLPSSVVDYSHEVLLIQPTGREIEMRQ